MFIHPLDMFVLLLHQLAKLISHQSLFVFVCSSCGFVTVVTASQAEFKF